MTSRSENIREHQAAIIREATHLMRDLETCLTHGAALAAEVAEGGELVPVGVREIARRLTTELPGVAATLQALRERR